MRSKKSKQWATNAIVCKLRRAFPLFLCLLFAQSKTHIFQNLLTLQSIDFKPVDFKLMYIGRFAPSPSGPLHFGSLVCALASYLDAKHHSGQWLVRIEDIDPPREQAGASERILTTLKTHGLHWDQPIVYQSHRSDLYLDMLKKLTQCDIVYRCNCTRQRLKHLPFNYDQHCLHTPPPLTTPAALRLNTVKGITYAANKTKKMETQQTFTDLIQGEAQEDFAVSGDFVVHRKDGYFAYQTAVTTDDINQGITHVVRGNDLLNTTPQQILLHGLLDATPPQYAHIPVIIGDNNIKLSKQNHAPAIDNHAPQKNLILAMKALNMHPPMHNDITITNLLTWATEHWSLIPLRLQQTIAYRDLLSN